MRRNGDDWKNAPLWMKELHAWQAGRRGKLVLTMPAKVSRELSFLRPVLPCGIEALRGLDEEKGDMSEISEKLLKIYDAETDEYRTATQADIDALWRKVQLMGVTIGALRRALTRFDEMITLDREKRKKDRMDPEGGIPGRTDALED